MGRIKEEKARTQAMLNPKKKWAAKNKDSSTPQELNKHQNMQQSQENL